MTKTNDIKKLWGDILVTQTYGFRRLNTFNVVDFYVGLDEESQYVFLIVCSDKPPTQTDMRSVTVKVKQRDDGKWSMFLILRDARLLDLFSYLSADLVESSAKYESATPALKALFTRLSGWRQLLEKGDSGLLSESKIRGLSGELIILKHLIAALGAEAAVNGWVGPCLADQDFQIDEKAWEVKTIRPGADSVAIASERQLDATARSIHLVVLEIATSSIGIDNSFTLNDLVGQIGTTLSISFDLKVKFEQLLLLAGYVTRPEYDLCVMSERSISAYRLLPGFPKLAKNDLPDGVRDVSYKVDLSRCLDFKATISEAYLGFV